ncbi:hypothetical protein EST38_g2354 [Candolleomyces aberdarensis]|uniref:Cytochrome P450 n=1 Tax=Candolleomyces aberdarensis TaxID=2316362 RepID=A0A4Q2DT69_9AGAR|nr:hypothetical protein EST38_g2354 [Candolleomyces aberdarensis]
MSVTENVLAKILRLTTTSTTSRVAQVALIYGSTWVLWKLVRRVAAKKKTSSLESVAGPDGGSLLAVSRGCVWLVEKTLYVFDPKALYHVIVKDLYIFEESKGFSVFAGLTWGQGLLATVGEQHRKQRKMLNPVFSMGHMRGVIPSFYEVVHRLSGTFENQLASSGGAKEIEMVHWVKRTSLELIGKSGLGYSFDALTENAVEHPYSRSVKMFNEVSSKLIFAQTFLLPLVHNIGSPKFRRWVVDTVPWKNLHELRDIVDVMHEAASEIVEVKKREYYENKTKEELGLDVDEGKAVKANMEADERDKLDDAELTGQIATLTFAAMDTTSSALARLLHLLSEHQDAQNRLRDEIQRAYASKRSGGRALSDEDEEETEGQLNYDELMNLSYLDGVVRETLRLYPPAPTVLRETLQDVVMPFSKPLLSSDGKTYITEVVVPKGTKVFPALYAANRNKDIWGEDAEEWKPERWVKASETGQKVVNERIPGVYSHLMTFIGGGRACIGFKFAELEIKVTLCVLLSKFKFNMPKDKNISWRMTPVVTPSVDGGNQPKMPLVVTRVQS